MRFLFFALFSLSVNLISAQQIIYPSAEIITKERLQNDNFNMKLYAWKDSAKIELGNMQTIIEVSKQTQQLFYIQKVRLGNFTSDWIDSTVINLNDFSPIYYSTRKPGDETMLYFKNDTVRGIWNVFNKSQEITDSTKPPFFDYHFLPVLLCWLPLKDGESFEIPVYDFIVGRNGMTKVSVTKIQTIYRDKKKLMEVTVKEHIRKNSGSVFYIDAVTHRLLQVDINKGEKKTQMVREPPPTL